MSAVGSAGRLRGWRFASAIVGFVVACTGAAGADGAAGKQRIVEEARHEFELLSDGYAAGTSKLYSRGDFLPLDDPRAISEGDFIGRLRALFGGVDHDQYVLRHRKSGFVITAYAAQSGPSYGGGPCYLDQLPKPGEMPLHAQLFAQSQARQERIKADPILARGRPDWSTIDRRTSSSEQIRVLRQREHEYVKRFNDVAAPVGFAAVAARLDELVAAVAPVDWEATRYWGEDPSVYRVGVRNGRALDEQLSPGDGLEWLLSQAQSAQRSKVTSGGLMQSADQHAVAYWLRYAKEARGSEATPLQLQLQGALPRVQAAWFRYVEWTRTKTPLSVRKILLEQARAQVSELKIDAARAERALQLVP
jgi:hypothetical protein